MTIPFPDTAKHVSVFELTRNVDVLDDVVEDGGVAVVRAGPADLQGSALDA